MFIQYLLINNFSKGILRSKLLQLITATFNSIEFDKVRGILLCSDTRLKVLSTLSLEGEHSLEPCKFNRGGKNEVEADIGARIAVLDRV